MNNEKNEYYLNLMKEILSMDSVQKVSQELS